MGWAVGYDEAWKRDIGYGVPARCDHPDCWRRIDRGLACVCGGEPYGGEDGCGLYFCCDHLVIGVDRMAHQVCERCARGQDPFEPKPDVPRWIRHKLNDPTWRRWREGNPSEVEAGELALRRRRVSKRVPTNRSGPRRVRLWPR